MSISLLITPPFSQTNTPYPATCYLKGFLNTIDEESFQIDLSLLTILEIFSTEGLQKIFSIDFIKDREEKNKKKISQNSARILFLKDDYISTINIVIEYLQGKNQSMAKLICEGGFLPRASRFEQMPDLHNIFGELGTTDHAKYLCTLYLEDLIDYISEVVDENFGFSRYAEHLGRYANSFDMINRMLNSPVSLIDSIMLNILEKSIENINPDVVMLSVPFPGNLYSALRCGQWIKKNRPDIKVEMGGGFANTELRRLSDSEIFKYVDFITLDDGERPLEQILKYINGEIGKDSLVRTYLCENTSVAYYNNTKITDYGFNETGTPDYSDLPLDKYISVIEVVNPMHKLWSDGRWNKLTFAHGCYWGKCSFCDGSLDYIKRYEPANATVIVDRIEAIIKQTGERGFHFTDEAAPPQLMKDVALEIMRREVKITWWTNVRFEKSFTYDLCRLLSASGCIAVSGGLEVASDRILKLINKGVTIEQVAKVASNFTESGIMVHAYLMYGFPTQTAQETVDSLEVVRQLFKAGVVKSAFWHRFAMTAHSPVGLNPDKFGIKGCESGFAGFADNDREFIDEQGTDHEMFSSGLRKSLFNYLHNVCLEYPIDFWFEFKVPRTTISPNRINNAIESHISLVLDKPAIWIGNTPSMEKFNKQKKGKVQQWGRITINNRSEEVEIEMCEKTVYILFEFLNEINYRNYRKLTLKDLEDRISESLNVSFNRFLESEEMQDLFSTGLLIL